MEEAGCRRRKTGFMQKRNKMWEVDVVGETRNKGRRQIERKRNTRRWLDGGRIIKRRKVNNLYNNK